jgi:hypothetical protein
MKKPQKSAPPAPLVSLGFRVDHEFKEALEKAAEDDERTLSSLVQKVLREWLRERKYLK